MIKVSYNELEALGISTDTLSLDEIPELCLKVKRDEVIEAYIDAFGGDVEDFEDIDDWIGFGSITCFEMGGGTLVGFGFNEIQMLIVKTF